MPSAQDSSTTALLRRLWRTHLRDRRPAFALAMAAMVLGAAATAGFAYVIRDVVDLVFIEQNQTMLVVVPCVVVALGTVKGIASYAASVIMARIGLGIVAAFQGAMFRHILDADLAFFHGGRTGTLISRFTNDVNVMRMSLSNALVGLVKDSLTLVFLVAVLFHQDWRLALATSVVFPVAVLPILRIGRRMRSISRRSQTGWGELTAILEQAFTGIRQVKAYRLEAREAERADRAIVHVRDLAVKATRVRTLARPILETLGAVALGGVVYYGGAQIIAGNITPGVIVAFMSAFLLAYQPMKSVAALNASLQAGLAAAQRCFALLDQKPEIVDAPGARPLVVDRGEIALEDVSFEYGEGGREAPALDRVSLTVPPGKTVALVGPSGAGKSTLMNLIPRFHDATGGRVLIDGRDVREVTLASLRDQLALVSQEISLLDDTLAANIACGRPGAGRAEVEEAARNAGAEAFILATAEGYETRIGEQGVRLSGGQRQRIAIARAILKDAPILLLDEATSALDTETERLVQAALRRLMRGRSTLVIAHRLSTVARADLICVMREGRVVETGTHGALLERGGAYARLHEMQFADDARDVA